MTIDATKGGISRRDAVSIPEIDILWMTAGLGRDGDTVAGVSGKRNVRFGIEVGHGGKGRRREPASCQNRKVFEERASGK